MRVAFWITIIISGFVTVAAFYYTNRTTFEFDPNNITSVGMNGGLFFITVPFLIILLFFFQMMFVFEKIHEKIKLDEDILKNIYLALFALILTISAVRVIKYHAYIQSYYSDEVGYLNAHSNHLFFNIWTFIACLCLSALGSFYMQKKPKAYHHGDW